MPSGRHTRHIDMPGWMYEQLRALAEEQGRTITDVHRELLTTALLQAATTDERPSDDMWETYKEIRRQWAKRLENDK